MAYYVYILSNYRRTVLYIGVTNDLERRIEEHRSGLADGFTKRYLVRDLVYYEETEDVMSAIAREKELKGWRRARKAQLVETMNPQWRDLSVEL